MICRDIVDRVCKRTVEKGIDDWWLSSPEELIGDELMKQLQLTPGHIEKGQVKFSLYGSIVSRNTTLLLFITGHYGHLV